MLFCVKWMILENETSEKWNMKYLKEWKIKQNGTCYIRKMKRDINEKQMKWMWRLKHVENGTNWFETSEKWKK